MKEKKVKPKYARICPKCNSLDINQETPGASSNIIFGLPTLYKCKNCGFTSYIFPEVDLNEKHNLDLKEKNKEEHNKDKKFIN
jgi:hypothetical protein